MKWGILYTWKKPSPINLCLGSLKIQDDYPWKIQGQFMNSRDRWHMWQAFTDYRITPYAAADDDEPSFSYVQNNFYTWLETQSNISKYPVYCWKQQKRLLVPKIYLAGCPDDVLVCSLMSLQTSLTSPSVLWPKSSWCWSKRWYSVRFNEAGKEQTFNDTKSFALCLFAQLVYRWCHIHHFHLTF